MTPRSSRLELRPRTPRGFLAWFLAAALVAPAAAHAADRQFNTGSLIIPASIEYQSDVGVLATYSVAYITLVKNATRTTPITLYWAVQPKKRSQYHCDTSTNTLPSYGSWNDNDGCDFYVQNTNGGQPVSLVNPNGTVQSGSFSIWPVTKTTNAAPARGSPQNVVIGSSTTAVKYLGGAWIIDAQDAPAFLAMLNDTANYPELAAFHANGTSSGFYMNIHQANAAFTAPIVSELKSQPPHIAMLGTTGSAVSLPTVLQKAGLCNLSGTAGAPGLANCGATSPPAAGTWAAGTVYDWYGSPADLFGSNPPAGYPQGALNGTIGTGTNAYTYGIMWAGDSSLPGNLTDTGGNPGGKQATNLSTFLESRGNTLFAIYDSVGYIENVEYFQTTAGVTSVTKNSTLTQNSSDEDCNDDHTGLVKFAGNGTPCLVYGGWNQAYGQVGNFQYQSNGSQGSDKAFYPATGSNWLAPVTQLMQVNDPTATPALQSVATAVNKNGSMAKGLILYLAGKSYDQPARFWGERLILNTLFSRLNAPQTEFARSEPVGYTATSGTTSTNYVFQGTFVPLPPPSDNDTLTYNASHPELWQFPYTQGHLYEYNLANISTTTGVSAAQTFGSTNNTNAATWDAAVQLANQSPGNRVVFTYTGTSPGSVAPYLGSVNLGWKKVYFYKDAAGTVHDETSSSCTDANGDGLCDLSQMLAATNTAQLTAPLSKTSPDATTATTAKLFLQQVLGYCSAHDPTTHAVIWQPSSGSCDNYDSTGQVGQTNKPALGGIDHGTPAIVGPSRYVSGAPYVTRPVVAYAGGNDGMLHAFYVSGSTTWSGDGFSLPAGVQPGQELWAFVPPGQVGELGFNSAMVDGSINVVDVFGDFPYDSNGDGTIDWTTGAYDASTNPTGEAPNHQRRWRTVLVATVGQQQQSAWANGSEIFALDVTNPLNPVLLWRIGGSTEHDGRWDTNGNGLFESAEAFDSTLPATYALKWSDADGTNYNTTSATTIAAMKCGRFDYSNLGSAYSTAVAKVWNGGAYQYLVFVATNAQQFSPQPVPPASAVNPTACGTSNVSRGAEIFAIDLVTGQKQWQWEHDYQSADLTAAGVDNSVPPRLALGDIDASGSTERVYLGDMAGHLWELYARDGRNVNYLPDKNNTWHSFPLFGTPAMGSSGNTAIDSKFQVNGRTPLSQQPLTTPIGQGRFTSVPTSPATLGQYLQNRLALVIGTMGVNWQIAPYEAGHIFVLPIAPDGGIKLMQSETDVNDLTLDPKHKGVLRSGAAWDIQLNTNERVYGMPRVVNNMILFNTAYGSSYTTSDIANTANDPGRLWQTTAAGSSQSQNDSKAFGGVVTFANNVIVTTDTSIHKMASPPAAVTTSAGPAQSTFNRLTPAILKTWEPLR